MSPLARGVPASARGDVDVRRAKLEERALQVSGAVDQVLIVSKEGLFRAWISAETDLPRAAAEPKQRLWPGRVHRWERLGVGAGSRDRGERAGRLAATGWPATASCAEAPLWFVCPGDHKPPPGARELAQSPSMGWGLF